jgi:DNA-binding GntR family transcriptional regulator
VPPLDDSATRAPRGDRFRVRSLAELTYESVRGAIVSGGFAMGERLNEVRLAKSLGVSRGPVREALRRLREEGLVLERPRQGMFVREIGPDDLADLYNARVGLETIAVRQAVRAGADWDLLRPHVAAMRAAAARRDLAALTAGELAFHQQLCALAGNAYLGDAFRGLGARIQMALNLDNAGYASLDAIVEDHVALLDELRAADEIVAVAAIERHIVTSAVDLVARMGGDPARLVAPLGGR